MSHLPSFEEQLAVVYDDYMSTLGGGERSALAYAKALKNLGFKTQILTTLPPPKKEHITKIFGEEFSDIDIYYEKVEPEKLVDFLRPSELKVFINHTYMSYIYNPAHIGIYSQMFPNESINQLDHTTKTFNINSYHYMLSNSSFTKDYADGFWSYPLNRSLVLNPPIGTRFIERAEVFLKNPPKKEKYFVNLGRFNPGNHNKNQKMLMEEFLLAQKSYPILSDWKFHFIGNVNETKESFLYHKDCESIAKASNGSIEIHNNIPETELSNILTKAFSYVHGTGAFIPPGEHPHLCEHYGLSIIEAMAHGAIPLVYVRGGIFDILEPGTHGFIYKSKSQLQKQMQNIALLYDSEEGSNISYNATLVASQQSQENFTKKLLEILKTVM
jgi:glycosyltransferase involved in cell wall biosynthesis